MNLDSQVLEGATVTVSLNSETLTSQTTNPSGEVIFNMGNFSSWSVGDKISILASKTTIGTKTTTLTLTSRPQTLNIQLAQTSDLTYLTEPTKHVLNFSLLTDFEGNKITESNRLPVSSESTLDEPALTNTYDSRNRLSTQTITVKGTQYKRTFTYTGNAFQFTSRSAWIQL